MFLTRDGNIRMSGRSSGQVPRWPVGFWVQLWAWRVGPCGYVRVALGTLFRLQATSYLSCGVLEGLQCS